MHFIVTGGAGFIGCNVVKKLLEIHTRNPNLKIHVLDCLTYSSNVENLPLNDNRVKLFKVDVSNKEEVSKYLNNNFNLGLTTLFHLAAESHVDRSIADGTRFISSNVMGTFNMLSLAQRINLNCFVHVSTDEVYGSVESYTSNESSNLNPTSYYSSSKAASDLIALSAFKTMGLPVIVSRCVNNFGPGQHPEKFLPRMIERLNQNMSLPVYGDGLNIREWIYVKDHVDALIAIADPQFAGEVFNIGTGFRLSNLEIVNKLISLSGSNSNIEFVADRLGHDQRYALDSSKISNRVKWKALNTEGKFEEYIRNSLLESANQSFVDQDVFQQSEEFYHGS